MPYFEFDKCSYYYHEWGCDQGSSPLVLLHGFAQSSQTWEDTAQRLAKRGKVIALDFIGHGQSEKPRQQTYYDLAYMIDMLQHFIGNYRVDLLGYSMGGRVAATFAFRHPDHVRSLILESAGLGQKNPQPKNNQLIDRLKESSIEEFVGFWESLPLFSSQKDLPLKLQQQIREERLANDPYALALTVEGSGHHVMEDLWPRLSDASFPILYLVGDRDEKYRDIARNVPSNNNIWVDTIDAGHNIHAENPLDFCKQVIQFLEMLDTRYNL